MPLPSLLVPLDVPPDVPPKVHDGQQHDGQQHGQHDGQQYGQRTSTRQHSDTKQPAAPTAQQRAQGGEAPGGGGTPEGKGAQGGGGAPAGGGALVALWITMRPRIRRFVLEELLPQWGLRLLREWVWLKVKPGGEPVCPLVCVGKGGDAQSVVVVLSKMMFVVGLLSIMVFVDCI